MTARVWRGSGATLFTPHPALGSRAFAAREPGEASDSRHPLLVSDDNDLRR